MCKVWREVHAVMTVFCEWIVVELLLRLWDLAKVRGHKSGRNVQLVATFRPDCRERTICANGGFNSNELKRKNRNQPRMSRSGSQPRSGARVQPTAPAVGSVVMKTKPQAGDRN